MKIVMQLCIALRALELAGRTRFVPVLGLALGLTFGIALGLAPLCAQQRALRVCATTTDLGSLVREIGGDQVEVTVFCKGVEDPHFVEARPSFIKALADADLFVQVGFELEVGWVPVLLRNCRNARVLPPADGFLEIAQAIAPLEVPAGSIDRAHGDVHASGNPHCLLDPLNGWRTANLLRERLARLRPEKREYFAQRSAAFGERLGQALVGARLAAKYEWEKLARLHEHDKLGEFLASQGQGAVEGWLGALASARGTKVVVDHDLWPYFLRRFGLVRIGSLEPIPGLPPTSKHLASLIERCKSEGAKLLLAAVYYDPRHAELVARHAGLQIVPMAHQVGARSGADDYLAMIAHNVQQIARAVAAAR